MLIPKVTQPRTMKELRPISLCTVRYRIMATMIATRMKPIMAHIVSENQCAFVPGRLITDNVMIASEIFSYLHRRRRGRMGYAAIKLDMSNAYDRVKWDYLQRVMEALGFADQWIALIMKCISTVSYQVILNGQLLEPIVPSGGLRQGCPLSPYLFLVVTEGLTALIHREENEGRCSGCRIVPACPSITHTLFADDCLLFMKITNRSTEYTRDTLAQYEQESGQHINIQKSSAFFSPNTTLQARQKVCTILGLRESYNPPRYLGILMLTGRRKREIFVSILDRLRT